jgi:hypothetical protein
MTTQKSNALTTVSTLLKKAKGTLGTLSDALSSKWGPIIAVSAIGAIALNEWHINPLFRSRITSTYDGAVNLVQANELCHLHGGHLLFATEPQNYVTNGVVRCGFSTRMGVQSLLNEYEALGKVVLYRIEPYAKYKYTTN